MNDVGVLFSQAGENPMLLFDSSWSFQASMSLVLVEAHLDEIEAQTPPQFLRPYHNHLRAAARHFRQFTGLVSSGMRDADMDLMVLAAAEGQEGHRDLNRAEATLLDLCFF